jgi:hypothetical protein
LQQPPLHGCVALHAEVHWCRLVSHAIGAGQSALELQPHAPAMHWWPVDESVQSRQLPDEPHAPAAPPAMHWLPEQHEPPHTPSRAAPQ